MKLADLLNLDEVGALAAGGVHQKKKVVASKEELAAAAEKVAERRKALLDSEPALTYEFFPGGHQMTNAEMRRAAEDTLQEDIDEGCTLLTNRKRNFLNRVVGLLTVRAKKGAPGKSVRVEKDSVKLTISTGEQTHTYSFAKELFEDI